MKLELNPKLLNGKLIGVSDRGVKIELLGRMGVVIIPRRSIITNKELEEGDQVEIYLSYAQVIDN